MTNRVRVPASGTATAKLALVVQSPDEHAEGTLRILAGQDGLMLKECMREAGVSLDDVYVTYAIDYRVYKPDDQELAAEKPRVLAELTALPNLLVVVALGNDVMKQLVGKSGITDKRGEEITLQLPDGRDVRVLPTLSPRFVLHKATQRPVLVRDLVRAQRMSEGLPFLDPASEVVFVSEQTPGTTRISAITPHPVVSVDVETDEYNRPRLLAVGSHPDKVYVFNAGTAQRQVDWDANHAWVGHNLRADQVWLRTLGIELGSLRHDTMLMAHLLNENRSMSLKKLALELLDPRIYWQYVEPMLRRAKTRGTIPYDELGTYCANDVAATLLIHEKLWPELTTHPRLTKLYERMSMPLSNVLLDVESHGILFDKAAANAARSMFLMMRDKSAMDLDRILGVQAGQINYGSHPQVREVLYTRLGLKAPHNTETGEGSTDAEALMKLRDAHPFVKQLMTWRRWDKKDQIVESWEKRLQIDGRVRPRYNQTGAVTGRLSSHDPNAQNLPTDPVIRSLIIAPPDHVILAADYKTIEMGVAAWVFDEADMLAAYHEQMRGGEDLHTKTATRMLGRPPANKDERKKYGKTPNFGLLYQQGDEGYRDYAMKQGVDMTLAEAAAARAKWHTLYPGVREGWRRIGNYMKTHGGVVESPSGRRRRLPEFLSRKQSLVNEAWRMGSNFPVQCTAAEFTHIAAILSAPALLQYNAHLIMHVHDSLVFEVEKKWAMAAAEVLRATMENDVPRYFELHFGTKVPIPLRVDLSVGLSWGGAEDWNDLTVQPAVLA